MKNYTARAWAEINLDAITHNLKSIKKAPRRVLFQHFQLIFIMCAPTARSFSIMLS